MKRSTIYDIISMVIYASIIIVCFILTVYIFKNFEFVTLIVAIAIPFIEKFLIPRRKEIIAEDKKKKKNQEIFSIIGELSKISIERVAEKHMREINRDKAIFALITKLRSYEEGLIDLNIILSTSNKRGTTWTNFLMEKKLNISANVDDANARVWYANIYLNGKHNEYPALNELKSEVFPILETFRLKNNIKWDEKTREFFNDKENEFKHLIKKDIKINPII